MSYNNKYTLNDKLLHYIDVYNTELAKKNRGDKTYNDSKFRYANAFLDGVGRVNTSKDFNKVSYAEKYGQLAGIKARLEDYQSRDK